MAVKAEIPHFRVMQIPQRASLREVLTVSSRGQITLPAEMRRHLGIEPGGAVIVEDCGGELRLKPAAVLEVEMYSDVAIAEWDQADALSDQERQQILDRLKSC
jgi:AbrB family looped-hinge helix DNA binding protein